jgi:phospholipase D1/2
MEQIGAKDSASGDRSAPAWQVASDTALSPPATALLVPGETCWRTETADRASALIDAAAYFGALRSAIASARKHVFIIGWDVDSRTRLCADKRPNDGLPARLLPFLRAVLRRRSELQVYILAWDFSVIYAFERELMPSLVFSRVHPRLHFQLDSAHVVGAAHHTKLAVVDDSLAFVGGIDLTIRRWDRPEHNVQDDARRDPDGEPYAPMHDVQMCVDGAAARALAELARERFRVAADGGGPTQLPPALGAEPGHMGCPWPSNVRPDFHDVPVAISRTSSGTLARPRSVHEVADLTCRVFETAERYIYIENQYFTSSVAARALCECLARPEGPEVVMVLPVLESGWLEQSSMGMLRRQVLARIRQSDRHGRLHLYYPQLPGSEHGLHVHCKLLIFDDRVLKVGSANLSNRSLGLDTETDVTIEARPGDRDERRIRASVQSVLVRLLSEHLGLHETACRVRLERAGSLVRFIESERGRPRCLEPLPESLPDPAFDLVALGDWAVDPERPMAGETFIKGFLPTSVRHPLLRSSLASLSLLLPVLFMAVFCNEHAASLRAWLHTEPHLIWLFLAYTLACSTFVPVSLLLAAVCLILPPMAAMGLALSGALLSACITHAIGRRFRPTILRFLRGQRARQLARSARVRAFRATVIARLLPAGNFTASNLLAGALGVPFWRFLLGNLTGLGLGTALLLIFAKRVLKAAEEPSALNIGLCCAAGASMITLCFMVARSFARPRGEEQRDSADAQPALSPAGRT